MMKSVVNCSGIVLLLYVIMSFVRKFIIMIIVGKMVYGVIIVMRNVMVVVSSMYVIILLNLCCSGLGKFMRFVYSVLIDIIIVFCRFIISSVSSVRLIMLVVVWMLCEM